MIALYLIRHGQTLDNIEQRIQGHLDSPLTELGVRQAQSIADRLVSEEFSAIYSSDLGRASATAEIIASRHNLPVETTPLLREAHFGDVQAITTEEFAGRHPEGYAKWREDSSRYRPPGGESAESVIERCTQFLLEITAQHGDGEKVVVVGHGGSIKALICAACDLPASAFSRLHTANASLSILYLGERSSLWMLNDTCHLDSLTSLQEEAPA